MTPRERITTAWCAEWIDLLAIGPPRWHMINPSIGAKRTLTVAMRWVQESKNEDEHANPMSDPEVQRTYGYRVRNTETGQVILL